MCDKILGHENEFEDIFKATRLKPLKNHKELGNTLKQTVNSLVLNKFKISSETIASVSNGEGKIIEIEAQKIGIYKDNKEKIFAVKPICSHLGCELSWNNLSLTWDCPCHGSSFSYEGKSLYDPSINDLEKIELN